MAGRQAATRGRARRRAVWLAAMALAAGASGAAPAGADASTLARPAVGTGAASAVGYATATLNGSVAPEGSDTSYYFQYGPTRAYGGQTPLQQITALPVSAHAVQVSAAVSGLAPLTIYHYRLVAVNAAGATTGADRAFKTTVVPLSLQMLVSPKPTVFGSPATVQGTLSGTGNAGRAVVLQQNPFPYTAGFGDVGNAELTSATGGFSFVVPSIAAATQYRVVTETVPPVVSPVALEEVAVRIGAHVGRARRRGHARIYGTVSPAVNGMEVGIMRVVNGHNVLVAGTTLHALNASSSRFSRTIRVKRHALYRVLVRVTNGAQVSNYSAPLFIR
jgi:hypothetical protein